MKPANLKLKKIHPDFDNIIQEIAFEFLCSLMTHDKASDKSILKTLVVKGECYVDEGDTIE